MATPILSQREIIYDRDTRDYALYLDGELVGFARTCAEAETILDECIYRALVHRPLTEAEALAQELVSLYPDLSLSDALPIADQHIAQVLAYAAQYDAMVAILQQPEGMAA